MRVIFPPPGSVIHIWFLGALRHKGIVSDRWCNGKPMVIANARRKGVREITWDSFTEGLPWYVEVPPSGLPPCQVVYRARCLIGRPYDLFTFNCEHFVATCFGLPPASPQIAGAVLLTAFGLWLAAQS